MFSLWDARLLASACLVALSAPANAQDAANRPAQPAPVRPDDADDANTIIVIGNRVIISSLADVEVEDSYDEDDVAGYAAGSIGELLGQIEGEKGDDAPALLVNGRPVTDRNDVADLPPEAVRRVEVLPRGAAQRIGGTAGQRAYNVVLKPSVKTVAATASREVATEGGWANNRGDLTITRVINQDRGNLSIRGAKSGKLYESERDFVSSTAGIPYAPAGNIVPSFGTEVDPAFSAYAGKPVSVIAVPAGLAMPSFADLLAGANVANDSGVSPFRTLRGSARPIDISLSGNKAFSPKLSLSLNARLGWIRSESGSGLPSARFTLPASHPASPFDTSVALAVNDPSRPLVSTFTTASRGLSATLNGSISTWRASLNGRWDDRTSRYSSQYGGVPASSIIDASSSPFDGSLGALIPVLNRDSRSEGGTRLLSAEGDGPLLKFGAGTLRGRAGAGVSWVRSSSDGFAGRRADRRRELSAKAGVTLPLTGDGVLERLGTSELSLDLGLLDVGGDTIHRRTIALVWDPTGWLHLNASAMRDGRPVPLELLSSAQSSYPNVPFFDPLTGDTVDVTTLSGGATGLRPEKTRRRSLSATLTPLPKYRLQVEAEYLVDETIDPLGFLPPPSSALVAAFPDRFQRDASGTLILVDQRPINFARETYRAFKVRTGFTLPLSKVPVGRPRPGARRPVPVKLQVNVSHAFVLDSTSVLRDGLAEIDLKKGGAIGVTGGSQRDRSSGSLALTRGGTGLRAEWQRRGRGYLVTGTLLDPDRLTFSPLSTFDLKAFADLGQLMRNMKIAQKTRVTLAVDNLFNKREGVVDLAGLTPQAYQPVRRDAVGRTIMLELRKTF